MFSKIKELFANWQERRKLENINLLKLGEPKFAHDNEFPDRILYPLEINTFDSNGCLVKMHRYKSGVLVDQSIHDSLLSILKEERLKVFYDEDGYYFKSVT